MVKLIKLLLGVTLLLVLVVAIAAVAALVYFDPNEHKDFIVGQVEKATGRSFAISGKINLTYYPWLGVEAAGVTLGNAKNFGDAPFLHADRVALRIKTMPLLQKHYELDTFKLHGLQLNLAKNKAGVTNWSDLGGASATEKQKPKGTIPFAAVVLGGVDVKDGQISWQDEMTGQTINISDLNMSTGELTYGAPINLVATMKASSNKPELNGDLKLNGTLNYNLDTEIYALKPIDLVAKLSGKSVPGGTSDLVFKAAMESNLKEDTARIEDLGLEVLGTSVKGGLVATHIKSGKPQVTGELAIKGKDLLPLLKLLETPGAKDMERIADRSFDVRLNLDADLQSGRVQLPKFEARLLGASIQGNVEASDIQSGTPGAKGKLKASGPDLPALLQLAGQFETGENPKLGEYGRRLAKSPDRAFDVAVDFDADPKSGNVQVPTLAARTLGFSVNGQLVAKDMNSDKGKVDGKFSLKGERPAEVLAALDQKALSEVLQVVSVEAGVSGAGGDVTLQPLRVKATFAGKQIPNSPAEVVLNTDTQFNLKKQTLSLRNLSLQGLGVNVAGDVSASRILTETPAVSGKLDAQGGDLALLFKVAGIEPLATQLAGLENRSFAIKTGVDADLEKGTVKVSNLDARLLGAVIEGQVDASNIRSETPSAKGKLKASGPDLPALLQLAGQFETGENPKLGEYGRRLAKSPDRAFDVAVDFDADPKSGNVQVPTLAARTLGFSVNGQLVAKDMNSDKGKVDGKFSLKGERPAEVLAALDQKALSEVLQVVSVDAGVSGAGGDVTLQPLRVKATFAGKQIPNSPAEVVLNTDTQFNLKKQTLSLRNLSLQGLGVNVAGDVSASRILTETPAVSGKLDAQGGDLALLFKVAGIEPLATQLAGLENRSFAIKTGVDADLEKGTVKVSNLDTHLLGAAIQGQVDASNIQSKTPSAKGKLKASGPDLPALLQLAGQFETGENPKLAEYGRRLAKSPDRAFDVAVDFDADPKSGNVQVPTLSARTLGFSMDGQLVAKDMNSDKGKVDGKFSLKGERPAEVLAALDQKALSEVLQVVSVDAGVSGAGGDVTLQPLRVKATFAGKQIPNSPAEVVLNTDTQFNLKKQTLSLRNLSLQGLGVNVAGDVSASRILTETPAVSGKLDAQGGDLALLFKVAGIEPLATQLAGLENRSFAIKTGVDADLEKGTVKVSNLDARLLGAVIEGQVDASNIRSETPSAKGKLKASGPDLPALLQLAGQFETGENPKLAEYGKRLAKLADKSFEVSADFDADVGKGNYLVRNLSLRGVGVNAAGDVTASNIRSDTPAVSGKLDAKGSDLALLFKVAGIEPLATQLAGLENRSFDIKTSVDTDIEKGTVKVSTLDAHLLGAAIQGQMDASNIQSKTPTARGKLKASEPDLPALLQLAGQFETGENPKLGEYGKRLDKLADKSFDVTADFDADVGKGNYLVRNLSMKGLGANVTGDVSASRILTETPAVSGKLDAKGSDLALLFKMAGIEPLATQLASLENRSFDVKTGLDADLGQGTVKVSNLDAHLLGAAIQGQVDASNIRSEAPSAKGKLKASGPDLPALLQLAGQFQGKDSPLNKYGEKLSQLTDKSFDVTADFDADPGKGNYHVPTLAARMLGINLNGQLDAGAINSSNGKVDGKLSLQGEKLSGVLAALDQGALGEVLQSVRMDAGIKGQGGDIALSPLQVKATFAGKQIPNSPVDMTLSADTSANLDKQTLTVNRLALQGLGLNVTGNLKANQIKDNPEFSGDLAVAEFNLRQLAQQLNQKLPETDDKNVLTKVALKTTFAGSKDSLNMKDLAAHVDESNLNGNFSINHFTRPDIKFALGIDSINADRYLPPKTTATAKDKPVTPETAATAAATELPLDTLRSLTINGDLQAGQFTFSHARLSNIKMALRAKDGDIRLDPATADLYQGKYRGSVALDVRGATPIITYNSNLSSVSLEPLLQDYLQKSPSPLVGIADLSFTQLTGSGRNAEEIKSTLNGIGEFKVTDGILRGVDIRKSLEQVEVMLETKTLPPGGNLKSEGNTSFKQLTGTLDIKNGIVTNNDLLMLADGFKVTQFKGNGNTLANLPNDSIKYDMEVSVDESRTQRGEKNFNIGGYKLPALCRGQLSAPDCKPDVTSIGKLLGEEAAKDILKNALGIKTKKPAATSTTTEPQAAPPVAPDQTTTETPVTTEPQPASAEPQPAPAEPEPAPTKKKKKKKSLEEQLLEGLIK